MPFLDYECKNGHIFESDLGEDHINCHSCDETAEVIWLSPRSPHRQLQTPIVMFQYADGSLGVAGDSKSITPKNAERIEIRSIGDYRKYSKQLNSQLSKKDQIREERYLEARELLEKQSRSNLYNLMGNESDPFAREIYREALNGNRERKPNNFGEFYSMAMEYDRSNLERD